MNGFGDINFSLIEYVKEHIDKINMRFGGFPNDKAETRFWSMEIVESMVAFKIKKEATILKSEPIFNIGSSFSAKDFRFEDDNALMSIENKFNKKNPNLEITLQQLEDLILNLKLTNPGAAQKLKDILN